MFYLRALEGDSNTTTPGLRKFYSKNKFERLEVPGLLNQFDMILDLWDVIVNKNSIEHEPWSTNTDIINILDVLSSYNNEFWKYPIIIYYLTYCKSDNFEHKFLTYLRKLAIELCTKYVVTPTVNAVKSDIIKLNIAIIKSDHPVFLFKDISREILKNSLRIPHRNIVRMLLKLIAYQKQSQALPDKWEIEHILPKNYQKTYFANINDNLVKKAVEHIGNKVPFEKKLNVKASDNYFAKKKKDYKKSSIVVTKELSELPMSNWKLEEIYTRDAEIIAMLLNLFDKWNEAYIQE